VSLTLKRKAPVPKQSTSRENALQRALKFLSYRSRSEAEVQHKLAELGYSNSVTERTVAKLRELQYVNDETFARTWAQSRAEGRGFGAKRIEQELRSKGIGPALARQAIREACNQQSEKVNAKRLLERKFAAQSLSDPKIVRRAVAFLQRRGYSSEVVFDLLRQRREEDSSC
jgi:regulatory protein